MATLKSRLEAASDLLYVANPDPNFALGNNAAYLLLSDMVDELSNSARSNFTLIKSQADLPAPDSNGVIQLENKTYAVNGRVTVAQPLELNGSSIIGFDMGHDGFVYTGTGAFLRGGAAQTILSRFTITTPYGTALDLSGPTDEQLMMEFVGFIGCSSVGTVTGYRVASMKSCAVMPATGLPVNDGIKFDGNPNKIFIFGSVFMDLEATATAVEFLDTLSVRIIDINTNYFKALNTVSFTGVKVNPGTTLTVDGRFISNAIDGNITLTSGFDHSTVGWRFTNNSGTDDSKVSGKYQWDATATTPTTITAANTPVKVAGATLTDTQYLERMSHSDNRLTYTGKPPTTVKIFVNLTVAASSNSDDYIFYVAKNGVVSSVSGITIHASSGSDVRVASTNDLLDLNTGDYIELWVEDTSGAKDLTVTDGSVIITS